jgi:UTP--glucose-1-phosphate uridylyltransferase
LITDAVVPVAGLGTRLLPATRSAPKEMLAVVDKPVVQYVIEELAAGGIERVLFVTGRRKRAIEDHFDHDPELDAIPGAHDPPGRGMRLLYTRQPRPAGLGDAIRQADGFGAGGGVVVALGDAIIAPPPSGGPGIVARLGSAYLERGADAALAVVEVEAEAAGYYGIVVPREADAAPGAGIAGGGNVVGVADVAEVIEKPRPGTVPSRLAIAARYVLGPAVFAALRDTDPDARGEVQLADALAAVIADGGRVVAVRLAPGERRHDIGSVQGYCAAFLEHALRHPELGPALRARAATLLDESG